jgi:hypothetical protein
MQGLGGVNERAMTTLMSLFLCFAKIGCWILDASYQHPTSKPMGSDKIQF